MADKFLKSCWIFRKLVTPGVSGSLIMNPEPDLQNSKWRIQYVEKKFKMLMDFSKYNFSFVIRNPNNPQMPSFTKIQQFFENLSAILNPPFWILRIWPRICNQRPQKPRGNKFYTNFLNMSFKNEFFRKKERF